MISSGKYSTIKNVIVCGLWITNPPLDWMSYQPYSALAFCYVMWYLSNAFFHLKIFTTVFKEDCRKCQTFSV